MNKIILLFVLTVILIIFSKRIFNTLMSVIKSELTLREFSKSFVTIVRSSIIILFLCAILWLCGSQVDFYRTLRNIITNLLVMRVPPRSELYTQFAKEFELSENNDSRLILNGQILTRKELETRLYIGIYNMENISLRNVLFRIYLPKEIILINEQQWRGYWEEFDTSVGRGFQAKFRDNIQPERGAHFDRPIQIKFPGPGSYTISYNYFCEDFSPRQGYFVIKVPDNVR